MNKLISSLFLVLSFIFSLSAQVDTVKFNTQEHEISIDFQNVFNTAALGGNLVYKKRLNGGDSLLSNNTKVLRVRFGGFVDADVNDKESVETQFEEITEGNGIIESENNEFPSSRFSVFALTGIEWQRQRKRLQYYGGFETGYSFTQQKDINNVAYSGNVLTRSRSTNDRTHSIILNGVGGCKFFLSPNFSIGIETSLESSFSIIRNTDIDEDRLLDSKRIVTTKNNNFSTRFDYLNGLFISYYF